MKQSFTIALVTIIVLTAHSQQDQGIKFDNTLTWEQVLEKAKTENKYVFIDCYAAWCVPCKKMDYEVFSSPKVGEYVNKKFISIKVPMDTSKNDGTEIKQWYGDASLIKNKYQVTAYPTYLFFSPEGTIIHKGLGY